MSRDDQHFRLRLPADLRAKVEAAAAASRRSMTAEILERLEASFSPEAKISQMHSTDFDALVEIIAKKVEQKTADMVIRAIQDNLTKGHGNKEKGKS